MDPADLASTGASDAPPQFVRRIAIEAGGAPIYDKTMERVVNIARSHKKADDWDIRQQVAMSPQERIRASRELRRRAYPPPNKDVRECHAKG